MTSRITKLIRARRNGIKRAYRTMRIAEDEKVPFAVMCAFLEQESYGGNNVFGSDPTIFVGAGKVTKKKYLEYKALRKQGKGQQGVGPMQLTWWEFQDEADALGGCWKPKHNLRVGARLIAKYHEHYGNWKDTGTRYNGASSYGEEIDAKIKKWRQVLND